VDGGLHDGDAGQRVAEHEAEGDEHAVVEAWAGVASAVFAARLGGGRRACGDAGLRAGAG